MARTLNELFLKSVNHYLDKTAITEDTGQSRRSITYKDVWDASQTVSKTLASICDSGRQRSQFIAVCLDQCLVFPAVILGILNQGFGFAYVDPLWSPNKQNDYLETLGTSYLIHSNHKPRISGGDQQFYIDLHDFRIFVSQYQSAKTVRECSHPMAYAMLTSGSTGQPKIVRVPHDSIVPNIIDIVRICKITSSDVIFLSSPSTFDPSVVDIFTALTTGASLLITSRPVKASPARLLQTLFPQDSSQQSITILQMTPSVFFRWSEKELQDVVLGANTSLRALILGGEPFPSKPKLIKCRGIGNQTSVYNIYGLTEVSSWASIHQVLFPSTNDTDDRNFYSSDEPIQLGEPLSDTYLEVRDCATGTLMKTGCGEMFIGSLRRICEVDNEKCSDYCPPVYRATGDIVQIHADGKVCYIGRKDHIIKRWGHRISLENVEHIAMGHTSVKIACCVWDEQKHKLLLIVVLREALPVVALKRHFLYTVGSESALVPDEVLQAEDIPLTIHGKINRQSVSDKYLQRDETHSSQLTASEIFLKLWCEVLGLHSMETPEASFLDFGGTSLLAVVFMSELEKRLVQIPDDFANLLLSGEGFRVISERLCQFCQSHIICSVDSKHSLPLANKTDLQTYRVNEGVKKVHCTFKDEASVEENGIVFFSLRGKSIGGSTFLDLGSMQNIIMEMSWKVNLGKCIDASPLCLVYGSDCVGIVIGSHSGKLVLLDGCTGVARWSLSLPDRIESSAYPSACGKYIFIGCYDGGLYCVSSFTGKVQWTFQTKGMIKCSPVLCNNDMSVIFGSYDFHIYCVNSETGKLQWSSNVFDCESKRGSWLASPLVVKDVAVLCSLACQAVAVQTTDGTLIWSITFQSPVFSTPCEFTISSESYVVIAEVKGTIHCLKVRSGKEIWSWKAAGHIFAPISVVPHHSKSSEKQFKILVGCYDFHLYSLSVSSKNEVQLDWSANLSATISSATFPFLIRTANGVVHHCATVGNSAGSLFLLNLRDGTICSKYNVNSEVFSSSVVYKDKVYFGCRDDNVYCLRIRLVRE